MTNHTHLLVTPIEGQHISLFMQYIGRRYVPYINHKYGNSGSVWEGRYKSSLVQEDKYFLAVMRYIELNSVRAGMVELPGHYRWLSFCHKVGVKAINFISEYRIYTSLGSCEKSRRYACQLLYKGHLDIDDLKHIRASWQTGTPLGNDYFRKKVEQQLECKVGFVRRGRPKKRAKY
jgi:putative transposase